MRKQFLFTLIILAVAAVSVAAQAPTLTIFTEQTGLPSDLYYGSVKVKPVRLRPGTNTPITIDDSDFFVQQHYIDFLRRFPDAPGFAHWVGEIDAFCNVSSNRNPGETVPQCIDRKRSNTSGAFYLSNEFQNSANYLVRMNWGTLGQDRAVGRKCINGQYSTLDAVCNPLYSQYITDMATLTVGIVVNDALDDTAINNNKASFANLYVTRASFLAQYPANMPASDYVDALVARTGITLSTPERNELINDAGAAGSACTGFTTRGFNSGHACVLYKMVDGTTSQNGGVLRFDTRYGKAYYDQQYNPVFVFIEYLGYLRRNPDQGGYDHWYGKLSFYGNFVDAEMVRSFIVSDEYRGRF